MTRAEAMLCALCLSMQLPVEARAQTPPAVLRIGAAANETYAEVYYALDMGFFRDAGLDVDITTMVSGAAIIAGVAAGALDIGGAGTTAIANAHLHGLPIYLIAPAAGLR